MALHADSRTLLFELANSAIKPFTVSQSAAISRFISNEASEAAPTISAARRAISVHLQNPKIIIISEQIQQDLAPFLTRRKQKLKKGREED